MGVCFFWYAARDGTLERIRREPALAWQLVAPGEPEIYDRARPWWRRLLGLRNDLRLAPAEGEVFDMDKAWPGVDYLLTEGRGEERTPLDFVMNPRTHVPGVVIGYGCPSLLWAKEVRAVHEALEGLTDGALRARYDGPRMLELDVIPENDRDSLDDLMHFVAELRRSARRTAEHGMGWLVCAQ